MRSEARDEGILGVASDSLVSADYRAAGGGKAGLECIGLACVAIFSLVAGNVGAAGAIHGNGSCVRVREVAAKKCRVDKARSGGIQLGHKCGRVSGAKAGSLRGGLPCVGSTDTSAFV